MWPLRRPFEPSNATFNLMRLVAYPPLFLVGIPLNVVYNLGSYLWYRPPYGLRRHLIASLARFMGNCLSLGCVYRVDKDHAKIPAGPAKRFGNLAEVGMRMIPPLSDDVPRLPIIKVAGEKVKPVPVPGFMLAPKGTPKDQLWAKAQPGEKVVLFIVGGGYQTVSFARVDGITSHGLHRSTDMSDKV